MSFQASAMNVITAACQKFGKNKKENYSLHLEGGSLLNEEKPLEAQQITPTTTLILKKKDKSLPPLPSHAAKTGPSAPPAPTMGVGGGSDPRRAKTPLPFGGSAHGGEPKQGTLLVGEVLVSLNALPTSLSIGKPSGKYNENTNIWKEPESNEYSLATDSPSSETPLKAGTLNKLVVYLTSADNYGISLSLSLFN